MRDRQPRMKRHKPCLTGKSGRHKENSQKKNLRPAPGHSRCLRQNPARLKIRSAGILAEKEISSQCNGCAQHGIGQIYHSRPEGFPFPGMEHQRNTEKCHHFKKQVQGNEIPCIGNSGQGSQGHDETAEKTRLFCFVFHVFKGKENHQHPYKGCQTGKQGSGSIQPKAQLHARSDAPQRQLHPHAVQDDQPGTHSLCQGQNRRGCVNFVFSRIPYPQCPAVNHWKQHRRHHPHFSHVLCPLLLIYSPAAGVTRSWQALSLSSGPQGRSKSQSAHSRP